MAFMAFMAFIAFMAFHGLLRFHRLHGLHRLLDLGKRWNKITWWHLSFRWWDLFTILCWYSDTAQPKDRCLSQSPPSCLLSELSHAEPPHPSHEPLGDVELIGVHHHLDLSHHWSRLSTVGYSLLEGWPDTFIRVNPPHRARPLAATAHDQDVFHGWQRRRHDEGSWARWYRMQPDARWSSFFAKMHQESRRLEMKSSTWDQDDRSSKWRLSSGPHLTTMEMEPWKSLTMDRKWHEMNNARSPAWAKQGAKFGNGYSLIQRMGYVDTWM